MFGVTSAEQVREFARHADAVVVGSRLVQEIERSAGDPNLAAIIAEISRELKLATTEQL